MVVKIRFGRGPVVTQRKGKNGRAALLLASVLTLTAVCVGSLGIWRLSEDLDIAGPFFFHDGVLSHWQVWIGAALAIQYACWRLTRYANVAREPDPVPAFSESPLEQERSGETAAANV